MSAKKKKNTEAQQLRRKANHELKSRPNTYIGISEPRFCRRANQWVVTQNEENGIQKQHWFSSKKEAIEFRASL